MQQSTVQSSNILEDWFDRKIGRAKVNGTMPLIFDNDPELTRAQPVGYDLEDDEQTPPEGSEAAASTVSTSTCQYSLGSAGLNYMDSPRASRVLDGIMYNVLLMNVKGTKSALLRCVPFPSYVLARIVLHKHMWLSRVKVPHHLSFFFSRQGNSK